MGSVSLTVINFFLTEVSLLPYFTCQHHKIPQTLQTDPFPNSAWEKLVFDLLDPSDQIPVGSYCALTSIGRQK